MTFGKSILLFAFAGCLLNGIAAAQPRNDIAVYAGVVQLKDGLNQGMLFTGPVAGVRYGRHWYGERIEWRYTPALAFGAPFSRAMAAVYVRFVPVDIAALGMVWNGCGHAVKVGAGISADFSYQTYPQQHGAKLFWFAEIGLAPRIEYSYERHGRRLAFSLQNSLAGFVSRREDIPPYFYSFKARDFFIEPLRGMRFASLGQWTHTVASVEYTPDVSKRHTFGAGVDYTACYYSSRYQTLTYSLQWKKSF